METPEAKFPKFPLQIECQFIRFVQLFCQKKLSARLSWSHNGVNIGTKLFYVVVIFTVIGVGLSHFLELVSSTGRLVCVPFPSFLGFRPNVPGCSISHTPPPHIAHSQ